MVILVAIGFFLRVPGRDDMNRIGRWIAVTLLAIGIFPLAGCRICADCEDLAYPAYGGVWERTRRDSGRVGSIFDPAGDATSSLVERDSPPTPDVLDRERQGSLDNALGAPDRRPDWNPDNEDREPRSRSDKTDDLLERRLDEIESPKEEDLRQRGLDDIEIRFVPHAVIPPNLN